MKSSIWGGLCAAGLAVLAGCGGNENSSAGPSGTGGSSSSLTSASGGAGGAGGGTGGAGAACSVGKGFSDELSPYPMHPTAATKSVDEMLQLTAHPKEMLSAEATAKRKEILQMYKDFGMDPALDTGSFYSDQLAQMRPQSFSKSTPAPLSGDYLAPFSIDTAIYHPIPCDTPRVELPAGYFKSAQLHCVHGFDGLGYAVCTSGASDPVTVIKSNADGKQYSAHVRADAIAKFLPDNANGDRQISFVDTTDNSLVDCYYAAQDGANIQCSFAARVTLPSLGDGGGTVASGQAIMAGLIRKGEATNPDAPMAHGIIIVSNRMWKARVYPAVSGDAWLYQNQDVSLVGGLVPYGAVVQLDPALDLGTQNLSLPARRILEAVQKYGAYLTNAGGPDFGIYTDTDASEYDNFGGVYVPDGEGVQNQVGRVLEQNKVYVVPPVVKR